MKIEEYYEKYGPMVFRRCQQLLKNEARAEEAMQDTFVQLVTHQECMHGAYPSSLLYRIATNICLNVIRRDSNREELHENSELCHILDTLDLEEKVVAKNFLSNLFAMDKESTALIAHFYHFDQMTLSEVAQEMNMSVSGVRKCLKRLDNNMKTLRASPGGRGE